MKDAKKSDKEIQKAHFMWIKAVNMWGKLKRAQYVRLNTEDLDLLFRQAQAKGLKIPV